MSSTKIDRIDPLHPPNGAAPVTVKQTGNITEIRYMQRDMDCKIQKLDKDHYVVIDTGEMKDFQHGGSRASNLKTVSHSLRDLRDILNTNVTQPEKCLWVTLTYAKNMQDKNQLYQNFRKFWMRLKTYLLRSQFWPCEYIAVAEPQARGAWHLHIVFIFEVEAPFIPNAKIAEIWKYGFTKTKALTSIDNVGLYLTAYLADLDVTEALKMPDGISKVKGNLKAVQSRTGETKAIVKGGRLWMYPVGFHLYRCSKGIKRPEIIHCTEAEAMALVAGIPLTFDKTIRVSSTGNASFNVINYRQYNKARTAQKEGDADEAE